MTLEEFRASLAADEPPAGLGPAARALWLDGKDRWSDAHDLASEIDGGDGARVHAYLHRKEGDLDNAGYWYRQARRPPATGALTEEWEALAREFLAASA
jgi:hypothetical protein